ncbi:MAG: YkgJ family cysteine cluster protein [Nanoarchaeota archaeon]
MEEVWLVLFVVVVLLYISFRDDLFEIYLASKRFSCKRCGGCCKLRVNLTNKDKQRLKEYKKYFEGFFLKRINGWCPFLEIKSGKATCRIYSIRPDICRKWPNKKKLGLKAYDKRCTTFKRPWFIP